MAGLQRVIRLCAIAAALDSIAGFGHAAAMGYYPGGKNGSGVYQRIINLMPPHRVYIEPFLGGGAIYRLKRPAEVNIGLDLDPAVIDDFAGGGLPADPQNRDVPIGGFDASSWQRQNLRPAPSGGSGGSGWNRQIEPSHQVKRADAIAFLKSYTFRGDELVYCDPPYLQETCSSRVRYKFKMYDRQHRQLLRVLRTLPCPVIVSGYWSELYARELRDWNSTHFEAMTRGGMATEWLWFNYSQPTALHDYRYVGENYRDRQRIKRKKASWTGKLRRMPLMERQALLSVIEEEWGPSVKPCAIVGKGERIHDLALDDPSHESASSSGENDDPRATTVSAVLASEGVLC